MSAAARLAAAARVLAEHGVAGAEVAAEGHQGEIAALRVPPAAWDRLLGEEGARVAARVRALGFRYVALDLLPSATPPPPLE